jgi:hypothetical protein
MRRFTARLRRDVRSMKLKSIPYHIVFAAVLLLAGCGQRSDQPAKPMAWHPGESCLLSEATPAMITEMANNTSLPLTERAKAVFTLFANHVRPGMTSTQVAAVLPNPRWLDESTIAGVYNLSGWVPVEFNMKDTVYFLNLFPALQEEGKAPWSICFRLSGGPTQPESIAQQFIRGELASYEPQLLEFALCYAQDRGHSRYEVFSLYGTKLFGEPNGHTTLSAI